MLDALVAEAREHWRLDVADGIQVVATERLVASPIEPSRPLLVVPLAMLHRSDRTQPDTQTTVPPLPGRHGPGGRDPLTLLAHLYPDDATVARLGQRGGATTVAELGPADLDGPLYIPPISPESAVAGPWAMPFISNRLRQ